MVTNCLKMEAVSILKMLFRPYQNRPASMGSVQHNFHVINQTSPQSFRESKHPANLSVTLFTQLNWSAPETFPH